MRIKQSEISIYRNKIQEEQGFKCAICEIELSKVVACLDHDHKTGHIRGVLCNNCNGIEGKIFNLSRRAKRNRNEFFFIHSLMNYWYMYKCNPRNLIHPNHNKK